MSIFFAMKIKIFTKDDTRITIIQSTLKFLTFASQSLNILSTNSECAKWDWTQRSWALFVSYGISTIELKKEPPSYTGLSRFLSPCLPRLVAAFDLVKDTKIVVVPFHMYFAAFHSILYGTARFVPMGAICEMAIMEEPTHFREEMG